MGRHFLRLSGGPENFSFLIPHSSRHSEITFFATEVVFGISKQHSARWAGSGLPFLLQHRLFWLQKLILDAWNLRLCFFGGSENLSFFIPHSSRPPGLPFFATEVVSGLLSSTFLVHAQIPATSLRAFQRPLPFYRIPLVLPWMLLFWRTFLLFSFIIAHRGLGIWP